MTLAMGPTRAPGPANREESAQKHKLRESGGHEEAAPSCNTEGTRDFEQSGMKMMICFTSGETPELQGRGVSVSNKALRIVLRVGHHLFLWNS